MAYPGDPKVGTSDDRLILMRSWEEADTRYANLEMSDLASALYWKELHDRERELRLYGLTRKAVFRGVIGAHLLMCVIAMALWFFVAAVTAR